jgi:hypothetical protein
MTECNSNGFNPSFKDKAARVYGPKTDADHTANNSISIDSAFTGQVLMEGHLDGNARKARK